MNTRTSWDTSIKHLTRHGILSDILTPEQITQIPRSNLSRWKQEAHNKYAHSEINQIIQQEVNLIKRINQSSRIKNINKVYFKLADAFHEVVYNVKGMSSKIKKHKDLVVNTIESVKNTIPINNALKLFNISRSTFENYKAIVIYKCEASYFNWCTKRFSQQLLPKELRVIKNYMNDERYKFWSKSSVYLKAVRDNKLHCGVSTFYKYCQLLGFKNKPRKQKADSYAAVKTSRPNQIWCADVTIFKTLNNSKHYIHFLIDHYSKFILGYRICNSASGSAIKDLLCNANQRFKPKQVQLLTDAGSENVNSTVSGFISNVPIKHIIAQKDVVFSNSMVEALNKVIKHQFLFSKDIANRNQLDSTLKQVVSIYNNIRPQMSLGGNTPIETFNGMTIDISRYTQNFNEYKVLRRQLNKQNICKACL